MKNTDDINQEVDNQKITVQDKISYDLDNIDLDYEISKLSKLNKRARVKSETLNIALVSLLLSISTAVSLINVIIPFPLTTINLGFVLKYFVIAISFQVVGVYWGMITGLLDGLLQFLIWGLSPLFRFTSSLGLMIWVLMFWLLFDKIFRIYYVESRIYKVMCSVCAGTIILFVQPFFSALLSLGRAAIEQDTLYGMFVFVNTWISLMVFDLFAIILFTLTTNRIQFIVSKFKT